jgi:uncharacterized membrane protein
MVNDMFENKQINGYTYATRFIMSWVRVGGTFSKRGEGYKEFEDWLRILGLSDEDVEYVVNLARNGKLELEVSAKNYMQTNFI